MRIAFTVNGRGVEAEIEPRLLLVDLLRERLGLTGTHVGCDTGQCGACTVHLDRRAVKSCLTLAVQADGREVTTVEGVASADGGLHPVQEALRRRHGLQCGFCTPGMVMTALDLIDRADGLGARAIRDGLSGNLCRCTGYNAIVQAIGEAVTGTGAG